MSVQLVHKLLALYPQLRRVAMCLDNDAAGLNAASRIHKSLREKGVEDVVYAISAHKDWNEELQAACAQEQCQPVMAMV